MSIKTLLVLVSYNSGDKAINALQAFKEEGLLRLVVENGSFDSKVERVADIYVQGHGNIGYGAAVNLGVATARRHLRTDFEWVVFANPDVVPTRELVRALATGALGPSDMVGFRSMGQPDRRLVPSPTGPWKVMLLGEQRAVQRSKPNGYYFVGALGAIRLDTFLAVGGFDPRFFLYFEEVDLTQRVRAAGFRTQFRPELAYTHEGGASTGRFPQGASFELGRSAGLYARRHRSAAIALWFIGDVTRWLVLGIRSLLVADYMLFRRHLWTLAGYVVETLTPRRSAALSARMFRRTPPRDLRIAVPNNDCSVLAEYPALDPLPQSTQPVPEYRSASVLLLVFGDPRFRRSGYALRNFATISGLQARFRDVTCIVLSGELAGPTREGGVVYIAGEQRNVILTALVSFFRGHQWMTARYGARHNRRLIESAMRDSSVVIGSMVNAATLAAMSGLDRHRTHLIWDTHNYDPELWRLSSRDSKGLRSMLTKREGRLSEKAAASLVNVVSAIVAVSERDAQGWRELLGPSVNVVVAPNGADAQWTSVSMRTPRRGLAVSFGSLGQRMTADGLAHFLTTDWRAVREAFPDLLLRMAGRDPRPDLIGFAQRDDRLSIVANPSNIVETVADAELYLFPQVRGYGSKLKVLEAITTGRPIVATPPALVGIPEELRFNVFEVGRDGWVGAIAAARESGSKDVPADALHKATSGEQLASLDGLYAELLSESSNTNAPSVDR